MLSDVGEVPEGEYLLPLGKANVEREGKDVTLLSYGRPMERVVRPSRAALVNDHGVDVELIDLHDTSAAGHRDDSDLDPENQPRGDC